MSGPAQDYIRIEDEQCRRITYFYLNPSPEMVESDIREEAGKGYYTDPRTSTLWVFWGMVFRQFPDRIAGWLEALSDLPLLEREFVYQAAWFSDCPESHSCLEKLIKSGGEETAFLELLTSEQPLDLLTMEISHPAHLDMLWNAFMASGDKAVVERIIGVLSWLQDDSDIAKLLIRKTAAWSLASNAFQHGRVMDICREQLANCPDEVRDKLQQVIKVAETAWNDKEETPQEN